VFERDRRLPSPTPEGAHESGTETRPPSSPLHHPKVERRNDVPQTTHPLGWTIEPRTASPEEAALRGEPPPPEGGSGSWLRPHSSKLEVAGLGPDRHRIHRRGRTGSHGPNPPRPEGQRAGASTGGAAGTAQPSPKGQLLPRHRSGACRDGPKPATGASSRSPPRSCSLVRRSAPETMDQQAGQAMESNVSMFTSKNVSEDPFSSR